MPPEGLSNAKVGHWLGRTLRQICYVLQYLKLFRSPLLSIFVSNLMAKFTDRLAKGVPQAL